MKTRMVENHIVKSNIHSFSFSFSYHTKQSQFNQLKYLVDKEKKNKLQLFLLEVNFNEMVSARFVHI